jgi:hypothetical protein
MQSAERECFVVVETEEVMVREQRSGEEEFMSKKRISEERLTNPHAGIVRCVAQVLPHPLHKLVPAPLPRVRAGWLVRGRKKGGGGSDTPEEKPITFKNSSSTTKTCTYFLKRQLT